MRNLLYYNLHRHMDEIYYSSCFFNKTKILKKHFDVHLHCNNINHSINSILEKAKFETKVDVTLTTKNTGYFSGPAEAQADSFGLFQSYDIVIVSQIDVYITDETKLIKKLQEPFDIIASPMFHLRRKCYAGDFYVINKPHKNTNLNWLDLLENKKNPINNTSVHEHFLYDTINSSELHVNEFNRYQSTNLIPGRHIDDGDLWHEHDNEKVKKYLGL